MTIGVATDLMAFLVCLDEVVPVHVIDAFHTAAAEGTGHIVGTGPSHLAQYPAAFVKRRTGHVIEGETHHRLAEMAAKGVELDVAGETDPRRGSGPREERFPHHATARVEMFSAATSTTS